MTFYMTFRLLDALPWAFRGDLDHIDFLKTLPHAPADPDGRRAGGGSVPADLRPVHNVCGPRVCAARSGIAMHDDRPQAFVAAVQCTPAVASNNLHVPDLPCPASRRGTVDFQAFGRVDALLLLQMLSCCPLAAFRAAFGRPRHLAYGLLVRPVAVITAWLVLGGGAAADRDARRMGVSSGSTSSTETPA